MKIIQKRQNHTEYDYALFFAHTKNGEIIERGWGYSFPCDENGVVDTTNMHPAALENFAHCVAGDHDVAEPYVERYVRRWTDPAIGICDRCGEEVPLHSFTNECDCGELYNSFGQQLAPREQWGEETGEHWSECW